MGGEVTCHSTESSASITASAAAAPRRASELTPAAAAGVTLGGTGPSVAMPVSSLGAGARPWPSVQPVRGGVGEVEVLR